MLTWLILPQEQPKPISLAAFEKRSWPPSRATWLIHQQISIHFAVTIRSICATQGFYLELPPS
jgi:hypothetical protein